MKRIICALLAVLLVFALVSCGAKNPEETTQTTGKETEKTVVNNYESGAKKTETKYVFDGSGKTKSMHVDLYSESGVLISAKDYEGAEMKLVKAISYDMEGNFISWEEYSYDESGNSTTTTFDKNGNKLK